MALPFNIQNLPAEIQAVLRFLGERTTPVAVKELTTGLNFTERGVMRSIRRLVNYNLVDMNHEGHYTITSEGRRALKILSEAAPRPVLSEATRRKVTRRLTAVIPARLVAGQPTIVFIGIDPPDATVTPLSGSALVELKVSGVGVTLDPVNTTVSVPPDKPSTPTKITVTPQLTERIVRVRIDAFQTHDIDRIEPVGGMYFDIPVNAPGAPLSKERRAVAMDMELAAG
jgi:predicted transcriptional regulator